MLGLVILQVRLEQRERRDDIQCPSPEEIPVRIDVSTHIDDGPDECGNRQKQRRAQQNCNQGTRESLFQIHSIANIIIQTRSVKFPSR